MRLQLPGSEGACSPAGVDGSAGEEGLSGRARGSLGLVSVMNRVKKGIPVCQQVWMAARGRRARRGARGATRAW